MPLLDRIVRRKKGKTTKTAPVIHRPANAGDEVVHDTITEVPNGHVTVLKGKVVLPDTGGTAISQPLESTGTSFFANSSNSVFNQPVMSDNSTKVTDNSTTTVINKLVDRSMTINNIDQGKPVLKALSREMTPGADVDSSARYPPPRCYPGTRKSLIAKTQEWLFDERRTWDLLWLHGPAGVGKSAVAQTIAEFAKENDRLGAAFFFSKTNKRRDPQPVFITLAYQLAVRFPGYLPLVAKELGADPDLLQKAPHVQFRQLLVEPLSSLSAHPKHIIILDGLDECEGGMAQLHIVELINNLILSRISLPIIWMICSRPEPHLMRTLSRADFPIECWREELAIDTEESRDDTARFIRTRFKEIHDRYGDSVNEDASGAWPREGDVNVVITEASGLFIVASTILIYIEDAGSGNPDARLSEVLSVIRRIQAIGPCSPMQTLDQFYTQILSEVPEDVWSITHQLLKILACPPEYPAITFCTPRFLSNFLGITRSEFYAAMRQLHSVLDIPSPDKADSYPLRFLHTSFRDYLMQPTRSGRFCASLPPDFKGNDETQKACLRIIASPTTFLVPRPKTSLRPLIPELGHSRAYQALNQCLSWPFSDSRLTQTLARDLIRLAHYSVFSSYDTFQAHGDQHEELEGMLRAFDYNSLTFSGWNQGRLQHDLIHFIRWVKGTSLHDLVRTHSTSETDDTLLSYLKRTNDSIELLNLNNDTHLSSASDDNPVCFLLGYGTNTVLILAGSLYSAPTYYSAKSALEIWPSLARLSSKLHTNAAQPGPITVATRSSRAS